MYASSADLRPYNWENEHFGWYPRQNSLEMHQNAISYGAVHARVHGVSQFTCFVEFFTKIGCIQQIVV